VTIWSDPEDTRLYSDPFDSEGLPNRRMVWVENGRLAHAVKNLRWNESPVSMLNNLEMLGRPARVVIGESGESPSTVFVPAMKVRNFSFTSISDAV